MAPRTVFPRAGSHGLDPTDWIPHWSGVTWEPEVVVRDLQQACGDSPFAMMCIASDGVWDHWTFEEAMAQLKPHTAGGRLTPPTKATVTPPSSRHPPAILPPSAWPQSPPSTATLNRPQPRPPIHSHHPPQPCNLPCTPAPSPVARQVAEFFETTRYKGEEAFGDGADNLTGVVVCLPNPAM